MGSRYQYRPRKICRSVWGRESRERWSQDDFPAAPLGSVAGAPAVDGKPAGDFAEEGGKNGRAVGRYGVPGRKIGIVYTFLGIFLAC